MTRRLRFPKSYGLFGHTVEVVRQKVLKDEKGEPLYGLWAPDKVKVFVENRRSTNRTVREQSFCHEVVHSWLCTLGYEKLNRDEKFVDQMGQALHQFLTTSKY